MGSAARKDGLVFRVGDSAPVSRLQLGAQRRTKIRTRLRYLFVDRAQLRSFGIERWVRLVRGDQSLRHGLSKRSTAAAGRYSHDKSRNRKHIQTDTLHRTCENHNKLKTHALPGSGTRHRRPHVTLRGSPVVPKTLNLQDSRLEAAQPRQNRLHEHNHFKSVESAPHYRQRNAQHDRARSSPVSQKTNSFFFSNPGRAGACASKATR